MPAAFYFEEFELHLFRGMRAHRQKFELHVIWGLRAHWRHASSNFEDIA